VRSAAACEPHPLVIVERYRQAEVHAEIESFAGRECDRDGILDTALPNLATVNLKRVSASIGVLPAGLGRSEFTQ